MNIEVLNFNQYFTFPEDGSVSSISKKELSVGLDKNKNIEYIHELNLYIYNKSNKPKIIKDISCEIYLKDKTILKGNYLDLNTKRSSNKYFDFFEDFKSYYLSPLNYVRLNLKFKKDYKKKEYIEIKKIIVTIIDEKNKKKKIKLKENISFKEDAIENV